MRRLLLTLLLIPTLALAQKPVKVVFENAASRIVWTASSPTEPPPAQTPTIESAEITLDRVDTYVCVLDKETGNMAAVLAAKVQGSWKVGVKDFVRIGEVKVRLDQGGAPPPTASVALAGQAKLVDARSKGQASFYGVPSGSVEAVANYREGDKEETSRQTFELKLDRQDPIPTLMLALSGSATLPARPEPPKTPSTEPSGSGGGSSLLGNLVLILLVAAGAVAFLFFGLKWIYANQDKTKDALNKIGVQVPDPINPDPGPVAPPMPAAPTAMAPIILPDAGMAVPPPVSATAGAPRLVGSAGTFELLEGVHVVGREAGLTVPLPNESTVSRRHAEIVRNGDSIIVRDMGSTNGTFVNGTRLIGEQSIRVGDSVQFGSVQFRVEA